jgi:hypothetical protein
MKKITIALFVGTISILALTKTATAQGSDRDMAINPKSPNANESENASYSASHATDVKNVNSKAVSDFKGRFTSAMSEEWFADKTGYVTVFLADGYRDRAYYDKKGHWLYSLIFYGEDHLNKDTRAIVKSTYYDLTITLVEEVQMPEGKGYVIHLEDKSNIRIVRVNSEGEMSTLQELTKS